MLPYSVSEVAWERGCFHQAFFEKTYAQFCEDDRSSLVALNRACRVVFLRFEQIRLLNLNSIPIFFEKVSANFSIQIADDITKAVREADCLPKIDDHYFAIATSISTLVDGLNVQQKLSLKALLMQDRHHIRLAHFLRLYIEERKIKDLLACVSVIKSALTTVGLTASFNKLNLFLERSAGFSDDSIVDDSIQFEFLELMINVLDHSQFKGHVDDLQTFHSKAPDQKQLLEMHFFGKAMKNAFIKPQALICTPIISAIAAAGHFEWAVKLCNRMGYLKDESLFWVSLNSKFVHAHWLIGECQDMSQKAKIISNIFTYALQEDYEYRMSQVLLVLQYRKEFNFVLNNIVDKPWFYGDFLIQRMIFKVCEEGAPDVAVNLLERLTTKRKELYQQTYEVIARAFEEKEDYVNAQLVHLRGSYGPMLAD